MPIKQLVAIAPATSKRARAIRRDLSGSGRDGQMRRQITDIAFERSGEEGVLLRITPPIFVPAWLAGWLSQGNRFQRQYAVLGYWAHR